MHQVTNRLTYNTQIIPVFKSGMEDIACGVTVG